MLGYLASPYSHSDKAIQEQRVKQVAEKAVQLINSGIPVISPIVHNVGLINHCNDAMEGGWHNWGRLDEAMLSSCKYMIIYEMDGWKESKGIEAEKEICERLNIPVIKITELTEMSIVREWIFQILNSKNNSHGDFDICRQIANQMAPTPTAY